MTVLGFAVRTKRRCCSSSQQLSSSSVSPLSASGSPQRLRRPRLRVTSTAVLPEQLRFHCFLSHSWSTGQDQTHALACQLQLLLPNLKIWLDVDKLDDVGALERSVRESSTFIIFLSAGYFRSANCRRELYTALAARKPIIVVLEIDHAKGGGDIDEYKAECREACQELAPAAYPEFKGPGEVLEAMFSEEPAVWVRVHDFQIETLKITTLRMLRHLPNYKQNPEELELGLMIPGEISVMCFSSPTTVLYCADNAGSLAVVQELQTASSSFPGSVTVPITIRSAESVLLGHAQGQMGTQSAAKIKTVLLLYLNEKVFLDRDGTVSELVRRALDRKLRVALVHEQDPQKGGCAFQTFFLQTPEDLLNPQHKLFDTVAIPLYPTPEHRVISLQHILREMGATPVGGDRFVFGFRDCLPWLFTAKADQQPHAAHEAGRESGHDSLDVVTQNPQARKGNGHDSLEAVTQDPQSELDSSTTSSSQVLSDADQSEPDEEHGGTSAEKVSSLRNLKALHGDLRSGRSFE